MTASPPGRGFSEPSRKERKANDLKDLGQEEDDEPHEEDEGGGPEEVEEPHGGRHREVQLIGNGFETSPEEVSGEEKENACHDEDGEEGRDRFRGEDVGRVRRPRRIEGEELGKEEEEERHRRKVRDDDCDDGVQHVTEDDLPGHLRGSLFHSEEDEEETCQAQGEADAGDDN